MKKEYTVTVSRIAVFHDKLYSQTDADYIKILLDDNNNILKKEIGLFHKNIENCLTELFNEYIKVSYEWPEKELVSCRKNKDEIEIIYRVIMPHFRECTKKGNIINITDFFNLAMDEYYVECITGTPRGF